MEVIMALLGFGIGFVVSVSLVVRGVGWILGQVWRAIKCK